MAEKPTYEELEKTEFERKLAQESLEKEFRMQTILLDNIPGCIALILKKGTREIVASNRFARELGAVPGQTCFKTCAMRDDNCPFCLAPELWKTDQLQRVEVEYRGTWYEGIWAPFSKDLYVHYIFDITERKRTEEALKESEERYIELFERSLDCIYIHDFEGNFIDANPAALDLLGYTKEEITALNFASLLSEDELLKQGFNALRDIIEKGSQKDLSEYKIKKKNGDYVYVESKGSLLYKDGKPYAIVGIGRDITERKWTEEVLRKNEAKLAESNQLLAGVLEHTHMMAVFLDPQFNFIWVNRAYADTCQQEPSFFPGKNYFDLYPDEENHAIFQRVVDTGEPFFVEARPFEFPDQPERGVTYWDWSLIPVKDGMGKVTGLVFTLVEMTGRVWSEEALRESEEKYRGVFDESITAVYLFDDKKKFIESNKAGLDLLGYSREELLNMSIPDVDADPIVVLPAHKQLLGGERIINYEHQLKRKDGRIVTVLNNSRPLTDSEGNVVGMQSTLIDITERVQVKDALHESEEKYRKLFENESDAVMIFDAETLLFEDANEATLNLYGYSKGQFLSLTVEDISAEIEKTRAVVQQLKEGKPEIKKIPLRYFKKKDGSIFPGEISTGTFTSSGRKKIIGAVREVTERRQLESQLRQAQKMESIGTLAGGIAHDFNNILFAIVGNTELALEDIPEWNPVHANLEEIKASSLRAAGIVKQLLNFSRKADYELKPIDAVAVIKDALKFLRSTIPTTIEIRRHLPEKEAVILADPIQINQALMNLCVNSSQSMEETGGILEITVEKTTMEEGVVKNFTDLAPGEYVKIAVSDAGPGIDSEIIDRIFDPYFTTKEIGKGSGMGLAVVLGIVKTHGGAIAVDSQPGKGVTFTMFFPVIAEKPVMEVKTPDEIPRGNEMILFVDDEKSITIMTQKILERLGYRVETRLNPIEALELFRSKPDEFDLVITDMTMPQMTGVKLAKKLKDVRSDIPVIICTGHSSLIDEKKAEELGIAAYAMKPIEMSDIAGTIRKVLDD